MALGHISLRDMPFQSHKTFSEPSSPSRLWRYMDFAKFMAILDSQTLHFASADKLGDPFEGAVPGRNLDRTRVVYPNLPPALWQQANEHAAKERLESKAERRYYCVSCWHESEHESDAMWKLYSTQGFGVAIQTTFGNLCASMDAHDRDVIFVGRVNYIDYATTFMNEGNGFSPFLHKRIAFAHEREVRAVIWARSSGPGFEHRVSNGGIAVVVDTHVLVQSVVVSPLAPAWFRDLVDHMLERYSFSIRSAQSGLSDEVPYWRTDVA